MRKEPVLGLAGLILTGVLGCETNRPYCSRCVAARNNYGQVEAAYRPKTVVTMRADEVPENSAPAQACPAIQLVSAPSTNAAMASGQAGGSTQTVTVTIPAMKIIVPVTAAVTAPPTAVKENSALTELPPTVGSMIQASGTSSISSSTNPKSRDGDSRPVAHVQKEEMAGAASTTSPPPPLPEAVPEPKPKSKSSANSSDPARSSRLSRLPDEPPPEFSARHSVPAIGPTRFLDMPPPPPPIPKPSPASGPALPAEEAAPQ